MTWTLLSLREWQRRPLRMSITTMGVALAVAALWSLLAFAHGYKAGLRTELDKLGAHILCCAERLPLRRSLISPARCELAMLPQGRVLERGAGNRWRRCRCTGFNECLF
jgi:hypothetical protein